MRIAWDGRGLVGPRTGIGWYTHHLIRAFDSLDEDWSADLYLNKRIKDDFGDRVNYRVLPYPNTVRLRAFWEDVILPIGLRRRPPDIWHSALSVVPPSLGCKTVATVHDVAFLHFPEILPRAYRKYWTRRIRRACERADKVIAVSESTKRDLLDAFCVEPEKVVVVWEAADPFYSLPPSPEETAAVRERFGLDGPFLLFVGTLEPRKNLSFLLEVHRLLRKRMKDAPPLLIVGGKGWGSSPSPNPPTNLTPQPPFPPGKGGATSPLPWREGGPGGLGLAGYLQRRDLRALYRSALMVLVPSRYEGFGLPAVEAMACGGVVLASNVSSLPEVVGEGGFLLPIDSVEVWVDKIMELADNRELVESTRANAVRQASSFSWLRAARETFAVYRELVENKA